MITEVQEKMEKCRRWNQVTSNGVVYDEELYSADGMWFFLFKMPDTTANQLELAKAELGNQRDAVGFTIVKVED